jgi:hypothetical protein
MRNGGKGMGFRWLVQVDAQGTVPVRGEGEKQFVLPTWAEQAARREIEDLKRAERSEDQEI